MGGGVWTAGDRGGASASAGDQEDGDRPARARQIARTAAYCVGQALLLAGLFTLYKLGRQWAKGREDDALANAADVWHLERLFGLPSEQFVQELAMRSTDLVRLANHYYLGVHFPAAVAFLAWVLLRHRDQWPRVRNVLVIVTGVALVLHVLYPLAPPRFLPQVTPEVDLVDTGVVIGPGPYTTPESRAASNQYAAMPSLHVGWALVEAWGIVTILRARARWLAVVHPVLTLLVVVLTAHHYWADGLVIGVVVAATVWLTGTRGVPWSPLGPSATWPAGSSSAT
nr:phosphatase PAP2 family protein [Micromonospora sp. DSM 115978]